MPNSHNIPVLYKQKVQKCMDLREGEELDTINAKTATTTIRNSEGRPWPSFDDAPVFFPYSRHYSTMHFAYNNVVKVHCEYSNEKVVFRTIQERRGLQWVTTPMTLVFDGFSRSIEPHLPHKTNIGYLI